MVENFSLSTHNFKKELKKYQNLKYIVSEGWLDSSSINLFRALAYEKSNIKTYYNEHNCFFHPYLGNMVDMEADLVDKYLTLGWSSGNHKFKKLASLYSFKIPLSKKKKYKILYVSYPAEIYKSFYSSCYGISGAGAVKHLTFVSNFFKIIPISTLKKFSYRAYPKDYFISATRFNKEYFLKEYLKNVNFVSSFKNKGQTCKEQMISSSLVIIDSISTAYLESLNMNIPTICFWDPNAMYLKDAHLNFFDELVEAKIIHTTPESAAKHLINIYENPTEWWNTSHTRDLKNKWLNKNFGNPENMIEYLLQLSK